MMYTSRKLLYYGAAGVLVAVMLIAVVSSTPMILQTIFPPVEAKTGTLIVKVTDAPIPDLKHLNLTINRVEVRNETGNWTSIELLDGETYFDLLELENKTMDLAISDGMPIGNYTKIRLQIVMANATLGDDKGTIPLIVPPGHIDIKTHFKIKKNATTSLIIDIMIDKIKIAERGNSGKPANLNPQFKVIVVPPD